MKWIKLIDSLPKEGERVLCITTSGNIQVGFKLHKKMYRDADFSTFEEKGYTVEYWQTLPKAPN